MTWALYWFIIYLIELILIVYGFLVYFEILELEKDKTEPQKKIKPLSKKDIMKG
jgi:hypothetical protein|tara:strand:- start:711 stop:872 length:162 start_codon:yes stop_codon:yes gene_type:complete